MSSLGQVVEKVGMTRLFDDSGKHVPVTVVRLPEAHVAQIKTQITDGYNAIQIAYGAQKAQRLNRAQKGHLAKAGVAPARSLKEFRVTRQELEAQTLGQACALDRFKAGDYVDVTGKTKGRGFSGSVRRNNFGTQPNSHGCSLSHRSVGSTGQNQTPGRVFKGKKMPGQYGNEQVTVLNLEVMRVDVERRIVLIKGALPGAPGGVLWLRPAVRSHGNQRLVVQMEGDRS